MQTTKQNNHDPFLVGGFKLQPDSNATGYRDVYAAVQRVAPEILAGRIESGNWWADRAVRLARANGWDVQPLAVQTNT
jgi:hypothetical protein